ncbi:MAG: protein kinase [Myxococcota bacterium]|nr:protein kinase [Myxococcota bacterium]
MIGRSPSNTQGPKDTQSIGETTPASLKDVVRHERRPGWAMLSLFKDMTSDEIAALASVLEPASFKSGDRILTEGEHGDDMYLLEEGSVRIEVKQGESKGRFSTLLHAPTAMGEMALITSEPRSATIIAHSDVRTMRLDRKAFDTLVDGHIAFARILTRLVGERLKEIGGIRRVGKYEIVGVLGKGNIADVFEALHPELKQTVALKMLSHALVYDPQFGTQFDQEAQIVANLNHPNIVRVFDFEHAYGTRFTVMERLDGTQLESLIYHKPRPSWDQIRGILSELGEALQYAHGQGLIHRDVKPSNVFITLDGTAKLLDFGIAVHTDNSSCQKKARLGSPCYMAPEQILGHTLDGRTDLYALGMTAYELIVGEVPFNETDIRMLLRKQLYEVTPPVENAVHDCPQDLLNFVKKATAKKPEDRFSSCRDAVQSLKLRRHSEPLTTPHRMRVTLDYGPHQEGVVRAALATFKQSLAGIPGVSLTVSERQNSGTN